MKFEHTLFAHNPQFKRTVLIATDGQKLFKMFGEIDEQEVLIELAKIENLKPLYCYNVFPKLHHYALAS